MPIIAAETGSGNFTPAPAGTAQATCVDVVDLGMIETNYNNEKKVAHKCNIVWEIDAEMDNGKRFTVRKRYTLSLHEKAGLRKDLESWRGKPFTPDELKGFDLEKLLNVNAMLNIVHKESPDKRVWANVTAIMPLFKGMAKLYPSGDYIRVQDRKPEDQAAAAPHEADATPPMDEDIPF